MNKIRGLINHFLPFSAVDGPGNRFVIFLQGCNFACINCHNPHTIGNCDFCGICVGECPGRALEIHTFPEEQMNFDESRCIQCDRCLALCPQSSTPRTRWMDVKDLLRELRPVVPFVSGVTVSGGEATCQADFVCEFFFAIKTDTSLRHLTTFIDSNGSAPQSVWQDLLPVTDGAMIDIKAMDLPTHQMLTGVDQEAVFRSIVYLHKQGKLYELRYLVIPGMNDQPESVAELASYVRNLDPALRIKLNAFRKHGVRGAKGEALQEAKPDDIRKVAEFLKKYGLSNIIF